MEYFLPGQLDIRLHGKSGANSKSQNVGVADLAGRDVDFPSIVDPFVESLVDRVARLQSEADQAQLGRNRELEPLVSADQGSKVLSQFDLDINEMPIKGLQDQGNVLSTCCLMCF